MKETTAKQNQSLFVSVKTQQDLVVLPNKWFCDRVPNDRHIPITFFKLNNSNETGQRYVEKQVVLNQNSQVSFFVNGKDLVASDIGLADYQTPLDVLGLQNLIQEFDITNICQGIMKPNLSHIRLNVFQSTDRWWHPKCKILPVNDTGPLCYSCQVLNNVILKISGDREISTAKVIKHHYTSTKKR